MSLPIRLAVSLLIVVGCGATNGTESTPSSPRGGRCNDAVDHVLAIWRTDPERQPIDANEAAALREETLATCEREWSVATIDCMLAGRTSADVATCLDDQAKRTGSAPPPP